MANENARFVSTADRIDYRPDTDVKGGDVIVLNDLLGVATQDIPANSLGSLAVEGGVELPKKTDQEIEAGKIVNWSIIEDCAKLSVADCRAGKAIAHALAAATTVKVKINA